VSAHRRGASAHTAGWRAVLGLLLLLVMPIGQLHRSSTGACRQAASATMAGDAQPSTGIRAGSTPSALAVRASTAVEPAHGHGTQDAPLGAPASGACGPAVLDEQRVASDIPRPTAIPVPWHGLSPVLIAAPPPAPPPRLS